MGAILRVKDNEGNIINIPAIKGDPGVSPTIDVSKTDGVTTLTVTDANDTQTVEINDGDPGVSPTIDVSKTDGVTTLTVTDANGAQTVEINDGETGKSAYEIAKENGATEETEAEWIEASKMYNTTTPEPIEVTITNGMYDGYGSKIISADSGVYFTCLKIDGTVDRLTGVCCIGPAAYQQSNLGKYYLYINMEIGACYITDALGTMETEISGTLYFYRICLLPTTS